MVFDASLYFREDRATFLTKISEYGRVVDNQMEG
jgi:hypothetical protein